MNLRTILFDLDGTLIDTNELIIASFAHTFDHFNLPYTRDKLNEFNGPSLIETFSSIDPERVNEMIEVYREHNLRVHHEYVKAFPYVKEVLDILQDHEFQIGIVTTKMRDSVHHGLEVAGLDHRFDTIITLDDVTHPKPHPEPVIKAMKEIEANPTQTIMVGDNVQDIQSGRNAGVTTAGVSWSLKGADRLKEQNPTYMLDDMRDLLNIVGVQ